MDMIRYEARPEPSLFEDIFPMTRWFDDTWSFGSTRYPPVNVWHSDDEIVVDAELPGVNPAQIEVKLEDDELSLSGERADETPKQGETFHRRERPYGKFMRKLTLPYRGQADKVTATYRNGILRIVVPRAEADKPRKIAIEAA